MKHWIEAARLRTLPLSVSGILVGSFYALAKPTDTVLTPTQVFSWRIFILLLLTTIGLQVLSNFANDYGDGVKGTDNSDRIGPKRAIQSGVISPKSMKLAIFITALVTFIFSVLLIYFAFEFKYFYYSIFFLLLGIVAIASAIRYTVGKKAYGYKGFGDLFVFVFFGLVSTYGSYFMFSKYLDWTLLLPAIAIGFLSVGVLNLNNMRDEESDRKAGKNTIVVKIGGAKAKQYHYFLLITAMVLLFIFGIIQDFALDQYLYLIVFLPLISHIMRVKRNQNPADLDPELKRLAISTFLVSLLLSLCLIYFISDVIV
ncbi:1,4-dihydroxy-2-naphthoate octaprenyltransferase [Flavobacterium sp.]|uniref:1,4-dihydroxy-2-naphthoate octaprenyltransferase n=1 Tax=Flavobacterium sp. TaxID=239 RepID=UPI002FDB79BE